MTVSKVNKFIVAALVGALACSLLLLAGCAGGSSSSSASASSSSSSSASASSSSSSSSSSKASSSSSSSKSASSSASASTSYVSKAEADDPYATGTHHAVVTVEGYDPFTIELDADAAPVSVSNFCKLANSGYYDGKTFYRFVDGFCMQGGTLGNSASGNDPSLSQIIGEFASNGVDNPLASDFKKGVVAMARSSAPNSASSTFFVTLGSGSSVSASLNDQYAAFGTIDDAGMAIVDAIVADYLPNVTEPSMGAIADESKQAKITSIKVAG